MSGRSKQQRKRKRNKAKAKIFDMGRKNKPTEGSTKLSSVWSMEHLTRTVKREPTEFEKRINDMLSRFKYRDGWTFTAYVNQGPEAGPNEEQSMSFFSAILPNLRQFRRYQVKDQEYIALQLRAWVKDAVDKVGGWHVATSGEHKGKFELTAGCVHVYPYESDEEILFKLWKCCHDLEMHELDEFFQFDGKPVYNPHKPDHHELDYFDGLRAGRLRAERDIPELEDEKKAA